MTSALSDHAPPRLSTAEWAAAAPPASVDDVERLCADRQPASCEVLDINASYGIADVIKRWARTPLNRPLMIALPHGVEYESVKYFSHRELVPVIASYCRDLSKSYHVMPIARLWYLAAPYVHVVAMADPAGQAPRSGSLFFPQHSVSDHLAVYDVDGLVSQLRGLPAAYQPITVCVHWVDVLAGRHLRYLDAGFDIVSAGHAYDPLFLYRLHRICARHVFSIHHQYGSAVAFSIKSGCQAALIHGPVTWKWETDVAPLQPYARADIAAFSQVVKMPYPDQLRWADHVLGAGFLRTPEDTAALIRRAERLDRFGFLAERGVTGRRHPFTIPTMYRRAARRVVPDSLQRRLRSRVNRLRVRGTDAA